MLNRGAFVDFTLECNRIYKQNETGKLLAEVLFPNSGDDTVTITHTFVDPSLRGQGIASQLLLALVGEIQAQDKKAKAVCPYAVKWFEEHPEYGHVIIRTHH
jgi:predicted GNAT family acetyltransferase